MKEIYIYLIINLMSIFKNLKYNIKSNKIGCEISNENAIVCIKKIHKNHLRLTIDEFEKIKKLIK